MDTQSKRGGARPGAGRKPRLVLLSTPAREDESAITSRLTDSMLAAAIEAQVLVIRRMAPVDRAISDGRLRRLALIRVKHRIDAQLEMLPPAA